MVAYSVFDARNNLSRLIADARSGIEVVITNRGVPVAQVVPMGEVDAVTDGPALVEWLKANPLPARLVRSSAALDAQIGEERDSWD